VRGLNRIARAAALLLICGLLLVSGAAAEELWSEEYYRVVDFTEELSDEEVSSLDLDCIDILSTYHVDLALMAFTQEDFEEFSAQELGEYYYEELGFGYGEGHDGFLAVYNPVSGVMDLFCMGSASGLVPAEYRDFITSTAPGYSEEYGLFGVFYAVIGHLSSYLEENAALPVTDTGTESRPVTGADGKPEWYPSDPQAFVRFHDEDAPRVVDEADIFTEAEETAMEARLKEIRSELGKDIVVYTDMSAYGLDHSVWAADFYDFNGYGIGDEYEGAVLFICMDPADRGFWTCCTGPETRGLFTEYYANQLDDRLYEYMVAGNYGDGAADWIENFRNLYRTGMPFPPSWLPEAGTFVRTHDADAPRVVDELGVLSEDEVRELTEKARSISEKYGVDVVIHTGVNDSGLMGYDLADLYYEYHGYGFGDDYSGYQMSLLYKNGIYDYCGVDAYGTALDDMSSVNYYRMDEKCFDRYLHSGAYDGMKQWLRDLEHMERTGRVTQPIGHWLKAALIGAVVGIVFGGICLLRARSKMAAPGKSQSAEAYLSDNGLMIEPVRDELYRTSTSRQYKPVERSSGGHGGSGGSSYSGSYSGSSGSSHSGSGRSF